MVQFNRDWVFFCTRLLELQIRFLPSRLLQSSGAKDIWIISVGFVESLNRDTHRFTLGLGMWRCLLILPGCMLLELSFQ